MKELIIDKNTNINKIVNKEEYERIIINTKVNPKSLKDFKNIKELTIKRNKQGFNVYNETHINELPFKNNVEKITFINIENYGRFENGNKKMYQLDYPKLKSINIIGKFEGYHRYYFSLCSNLEEIIINTESYLDKEFYVGNTSIKKVLINDNDNKYNIKLDYIPNRFYIKLANNKITIVYEKQGIYSRMNDNLTMEHFLNYYDSSFIKDKLLTIPDYVSILNGDCTLEPEIYNIDSISLNLNLLKKQKEKVLLLENYKLELIEKIIIKSNNDMSLFENSTINIKEYGNLEDLYIENNKLYIVYKDLVIIVDENGNKKAKKIEIKPNTTEIEDYFKTYKINEIEEYFYYKKLLESLKDNSDIELNNALNIVGDRIIKKLTK